MLNRPLILLNVYVKANAYDNTSVNINGEGSSRLTIVVLSIKTLRPIPKVDRKAIPKVDRKAILKVDLS